MAPPPPQRVPDGLAVPGDKSISHRALILAALAPGRSRIRGVSQGADVRATAGALRALGVAVPPLGPDLAIDASGIGALRRSSGALDCGNSGTTARLLAGVAASRPFVTRFVGDASLSRRPMDRVAEPLRAMGATVELEGAGGLPMQVRGGTLRPLTWRSEQASAQVKSAILLAGLCGSVEVSVSEPSLSRDHTERMLREMGARVEVDGTRVTLRPDDGALHPLDVTIPGDPSAAAFVVALATLWEGGTISVADVLLNPTRTGWVRVLQRMQAAVHANSERTEAGEPVGSLTGAPSSLVGTTVGPDEIPSVIDELPLIACLAARAVGETRVTGAGELRVKESDRISNVVGNLRRIGADAEELPDGFIVRGHSRPLAGLVTTEGDHRIAMAFGVLAALPGNEVAIDDPACVAVSYPGYWRVLEQLRTRRTDDMEGTAVHPGC